MKHEYIEEIKKELNHCEDLYLLDLILMILRKNRKGA